jgi:predicted  nucleic acid-binding Zn-ribbon protein
LHACTEQVYIDEGLAAIKRLFITEGKSDHVEERIVLQGVRSRYIRELSLQLCPEVARLERDLDEEEMACGANIERFHKDIIEAQSQIEGLKKQIEELPVLVFGQPVGPALTAELRRDKSAEIEAKLSLFPPLVRAGLRFSIERMQALKESAAANLETKQKQATVRSRTVALEERIAELNMKITAVQAELQLHHTILTGLKDTRGARALMFRESKENEFRSFFIGQRLPEIFISREVQESTLIRGIRQGVAQRQERIKNRLEETRSTLQRIDAELDALRKEFRE